MLKPKRNIFSAFSMCFAVFSLLITVFELEIMGGAVLYCKWGIQTLGERHFTVRNAAV